MESTGARAGAALPTARPGHPLSGCPDRLSPLLLRGCYCARSKSIWL
ncbi:MULTISPECIES: hypothetical protein [Streptomyces]|nr:MULTISPECIES: hypothetical protein [Streptomyces]MYS65377.1 hypothetical protein [Streptomyces sp. SID5473]